MDDGARKRTRPSTPLREPGPEPGASASSAIRAQGRDCEANSFCPPPFALSTRAPGPSQLSQTEPERVVSRRTPPAVFLMDSDRLLISSWYTTPQSVLLP